MAFSFLLDGLTAQDRRPFFQLCECYGPLPTPVDQENLLLFATHLANVTTLWLASCMQSESFTSIPDIMICSKMLSHCSKACELSAFFLGGSPQASLHIWAPPFSKAIPQLCHPSPASSMDSLNCVTIWSSMHWRVHHPQWGLQSHTASVYSRCSSQVYHHLGSSLHLCLP